MTSLLPDMEPIYLDTELALAQIGDAQAVHGMLTMLEETLQRDVPRIAELLAENDVVGANRLLHPLKGFLPIFCRAPLCEHVAQVEMLSKDSHSASVGPAYLELMPELNVLLAEVSSYLNDNGAAY